MLRRAGVVRLDTAGHVEEGGGARAGARRDEMRTLIVGTSADG